MSFVSRIFVNECLKNSIRNYFSFALISIGKIKKKIVFSQQHILARFVKSQLVIQKRIQTPVEHLRWSILRK